MNSRLVESKPKTVLNDMPVDVLLTIMNFLPGLSTVVKLRLLAKFYSRIVTQFLMQPPIIFRAIASINTDEQMGIYKKYALTHIQQLGLDQARLELPRYKQVMSEICRLFIKYYLPQSSCIDNKIYLPFIFEERPHGKHLFKLYNMLYIIDNLPVSFVNTFMRTIRKMYATPPDRIVSIFSYIIHALSINDINQLNPDKLKESIRLVLESSPTALVKYYMISLQATLAACDVRVDINAKSAAIRAVPSGMFVNLRYARLQYAKLNGVDIRFMDISNANLAYSSLERINAMNGYFVWTNMLAARMTQANLMGANLYKASFNRAHMVGAILTRANMKQAIFCEANLSRAVLNDCDMKKVSFMRANLSSVNLTTMRWVAKPCSANGDNKLDILNRYQVILKDEVYRERVLEAIVANIIQIAFIIFYKERLFEHACQYLTEALNAPIFEPQTNPGQFVNGVTRRAGFKLFDSVHQQRLQQARSAIEYAHVNQVYQRKP